MSYAQIKKRKSPSPIAKGQFSNDQKFYQELTHKLWESKPTDENTHPDIPLMKTKRATNYLTEENDLVLENRKLKETIIQMKFEMKSKLEADLLKQKTQFQDVLKEYVQFIDKILLDKKELQNKLDSLEQQEIDLKSENQRSLQQSDEFSNKLLHIEQLLSELEKEKSLAYEKIDKLKQQNNQLKLQHEQQILEIKEQNYIDFQKFEQIVQVALQKKDDKIRKLKQQLNIE